MRYEIETTETFDEWLDSIKDIKHRARILKRFDYVEMGNFGDHKPVGSNLFELRFFFGSGFRVYYTIKGNIVVFIINGGDKDSQKKDIKKAKAILSELE
jgi:putative addiction module killer protein